MGGVKRVRSAEAKPEKRALSARSPADVLELFHPVTAKWFRAVFEDVTAATGVELRYAWLCPHYLPILLGLADGAACGIGVRSMSRKVP